MRTYLHGHDGAQHVEGGVGDVEPVREAALRVRMCVCVCKYIYRNVILGVGGWVFVYVCV